jgi:FkbM family methyltransferase
MVAPEQTFAACISIAVGVTVSNSSLELRMNMAAGTYLRKSTQSMLHKVGYQLNRWNDHRKIMRSLIGLDEPVIFDVGASVGSETLEYRKVFPGGRIYAFEPEPESFQVLQQRVNADSHITAYNLAVSNVEGVARFNANAAPACSSLLGTDSKAASNWSVTGVYETVETVDVRAVSLDNFCEANDVPRVDILKLDVQGAEYLVLDGARRLLREGNIRLIFTEIILVPTYAGQRSLFHYLGLFNENGYQLVDICDLTRAHRRLAQADFLFAAPGVI